MLEELNREHWAAVEADVNVQWQAVPETQAALDREFSEGSAEVGAADDYLGLCEKFAINRSDLAAVLKLPKMAHYECGNKELREAFNLTMDQAKSAEPSSYLKKKNDLMLFKALAPPGSPAEWGLFKAKSMQRSGRPAASPPLIFHAAT